MSCKGNFPQMVRESGFKLRQYRDGPLDWRLMGSYETERILREQNFELVDSALQHLSEAPLGSVLETNILDSGIVKYFVMSQYAIQYLICCRTYLDESVGEMREAIDASQKEISRLQKSLAESNNEIVQLNKKITQIETIREVVYPCHLCTKNFISNEALNIHIGRKHSASDRRNTEAPAPLTSAATKDKDNDVQLINTIKMELEIKQLKERLNAAERNIKERSSSKKHHSSSVREDSKQTSVRTVAIQSNLDEAKEKDELSSEALDSEASERKEQLHGLAERISNFEVWQVQLKESNEQFISDINQKLEDLTKALEMTKLQDDAKATTTTTATTTEERVTTPCLEDLERILSDKVNEIGKVSANKLEEVVYHLEQGYKDKLEALERELKRLSARKESSVTPPAATKIPQPVHTTRATTSMEKLKQKVESEFMKTKRDDDTYSIEELQPEVSQKSQVRVEQSNSSESPQTYTKPPPAESVKTPPKTKEKPIEQPMDVATDISQSLSESLSGEESVADSLNTSGSPQKETKEKKHIPSTKKPLTRKDAKKLVNRKLNPHGFDMKSKRISHLSLKRVSTELNEQRNKLKLRHTNFYATRNRIRKFVEKLCSSKLPERAEKLLKNKTPLQPTTSAATTDDDDLSTSGSPSVEHKHSALIHSHNSHQSKPVPLPRKKVMFNTMGR